MSDTAIEHTEYSRNAEIPKIFKKDEPPRVIQQTYPLRAKQILLWKSPKLNLDWPIRCCYSQIPNILWPGSSGSMKRAIREDQL